MVHTLVNPRSSTSLARTWPWAASEIGVRKRKSSSLAAVKAGEVEALEIWRIFFGPVTPSATARVTPLASEPTMAWTFSMSTRRLASATPMSLSVPLSALASSTGSPRTPPAALIWLTASLIAFSSSGPNEASAPMKSSRYPILRGPSAAGVMPSVGVSPSVGVVPSSSSSPQAAKARRAITTNVVNQSHLWRPSHCGMACLLSLKGIFPFANLTDSLPSSAPIVKRNAGNKFIDCRPFARSAFLPYPTSGLPESLEMPMQSAQPLLRLGCPVRFRDRWQGRLAAFEIDEDWLVLNVVVSRGLFRPVEVRLPFAIAAAWDDGALSLDCASGQAFGRELPPVAAPAMPVSARTPVSAAEVRLAGALVERESRRGSRPPPPPRPPGPRPPTSPPTTAAP